MSSAHARLARIAGHLAQPCSIPPPQHVQRLVLTSTTAAQMSDDISVINDVGKTAFFANDGRLLAMTENFPKPLYYDGFGHLFSNELTREMYQDFLKVFPMGAPGMNAVFTARTSFIDTVLRDALAAGTSQVVILGSGFDSRAMRFYQPNVRFVEVDTGPSLDFKIRKMRDVGLSYPSVLVRGNYLEIDLLKMLEDAGVDPKSPLLIIWEGNSYYMPADVGKDLVRKLISWCPGAKIAFDSFSPAFCEMATESPELNAGVQDIFNRYADGTNLWSGGGWHVPLASVAADIGCDVESSLTLWETLRKYYDEEQILNIFGDDAKKKEGFKVMANQQWYNVFRKAK